MKNVLWKIAFFIAAIIIRVLAATFRVRVQGPPEIFDPKRGPVLFAFWHNRLLVLLPFVTNNLNQCPTTAMVSASKDGDIMAGILHKFGHQTSRGSSSRKGSSALRELVRHVRDGSDGIIALDGPRGPRYVAHPGIIALSKLTGRPIHPLSCRVCWKRHVSSWDRFIIPLPFTRVDYIVGEAYVPTGTNEEADVEAARLTLQKHLMAITED